MTRFEELKAESLRTLDQQIVRAQRFKIAVEAATNMRELWLSTPFLDNPDLHFREGDIHTEAMNAYFKECDR